MAVEGPRPVCPDQGLAVGHPVGDHGFGIDQAWVGLTRRTGWTLGRESSIELGVDDVAAFCAEHHVG